MRGRPSSQRAAPERFATRSSSPGATSPASTRSTSTRPCFSRRRAMTTQSDLRIWSRLTTRGLAVQRSIASSDADHAMARNMHSVSRRPRPSTCGGEALLAATASAEPTRAERSAPDVPEAEETGFESAGSGGPLRERVTDIDTVLVVEGLGKIEDVGKVGKLVAVGLVHLTLLDQVENHAAEIVGLVDRPAVKYRARHEAETLHRELADAFQQLRAGNVGSLVAVIATPSEILLRPPQGVEQKAFRVGMITQTGRLGFLGRAHNVRRFSKSVL